MEESGEQSTVVFAWTVREGNRQVGGGGGV